jgi:multidrug resistance efflux pump
MVRADNVLIPIDELSDRQALLFLIGLAQDQTDAIKELENKMSDLNQSVADLETAVDNINVRFAGEVATLQSALDAANQALAYEELDDVATEAALQQALGDATAAAAAIRSQVDELNAIGANPETPVEEPPQVDNSLPGDQPEVDNSLPGDQPHVDNSLPGGEG